MLIRTFRNKKASVLFFFFLLSLVTVYSIHLFTFTLFEGFTTFSNDAGSYMLLARKWSPFFDPGVAVLNSWPIQVYPPGFPWILAISGASMTLYTAHLFVSICLLAGIVVFGYMARRELGTLQGGLLTVAMCLLPGAIVSSMGILSENLYLFTSLLALLLYSKIKANERFLVGWTLVLLVLLTLTILTRTIGVALAIAVVVAPFFDKNLHRRQKVAFFGAGTLSLFLWQLWDMVQPQPDDQTYFEVLQRATRHLEDVTTIVTAFWPVIKNNLVQIISSFNHYLSLTNNNPWFYIFSFGVLFFCLIALGLRLSRFKPDSIYLVLYLAILAIWPFPEEMTRFLHPIMFLLISQPAIYFSELPDKPKKEVARKIILLVTGVLLLNSLYLQSTLINKRNRALENSPKTVNSFHLYSEHSTPVGEMLAMMYAGASTVMIESAEHIPGDYLVAAVKHETFVILADRRAITLSTLVSHIQQLCNLKVMNVDVVFLSPIMTAYNTKNLALLDEYRYISSEVWTPTDENDQIWGHVIYIDKLKLDRELDSHECLSYQLMLDNS